jgi:hypothetical protein
MSISTYFRPNIHQNGPEILGVKKGYFEIALNSTQQFRGEYFYVQNIYRFFFKRP